MNQSKGFFIVESTNVPGAYRKDGNITISKLNNEHEVLGYIQDKSSTLLDFQVLNIFRYELGGTIVKYTVEFNGRLDLVRCEDK